MVFKKMIESIPKDSNKSENPKMMNQNSKNNCKQNHPFKFLKRSNKSRSSTYTLSCFRFNKPRNLVSENQEKEEEPSVIKVALGRLESQIEPRRSSLIMNSNPKQDIKNITNDWRNHIQVDSVYTAIKNQKISPIMLNPDDVPINSHYSQVHLNMGLKFDPNNMGHLVKFDTETSVSRKLWGDLVLLNLPMIHNLMFRFKVVYQESKFFAIGACLKSIVQKNFCQVDSKSGTDNGCFLFYARNSQLMISKPGFINDSSDHSFTIHTDDIIEIYLDQLNNHLVIYNLVTNKHLRMELPEELNMDDLYPCVRLHSINESVEYVCPVYYDERIVNFEKKWTDNNPISLNGTTIKLFRDGDLALLQDKIVPFVQYKFYIPEMKGCDVAVGVCIKKKVVQNGFALKNANDHGCYLYYCDGSFLCDESSEKDIPEASIVTFEAADTVAILYCVLNHSLTFSNLTKKTEQVMYLPSNLPIEDLYPCVKLSAKGECIQLVN